MLQVLESAAEIKAAEAQLRGTFTESAVEFRSTNVGYQGGDADVNVYWRPDVGVWGVFEAWPLRQPTRYWNAFGVEDPTGVSSLSITCEINPPLAGASRVTAGAFARESEIGSLLLLHSGRIGGGRPGINMDLFWRHWPPNLTVLAFDGRERRMAVVCRLGTPETVRQLATFVKQVAAMKSAVE
jgi:hypothetical protein